MARKKKAVPDMLPRERLTKKAFEAISKYAIIKCGDLPLFYFAVKFTLQAERMRRRDLYTWLEGQGYRWKSQRAEWTTNEKRQS